MSEKLSDKILTHLTHSKTASGRVGCRVKPSERIDNKAWISIEAKKHFDTRVDPVLEKILSYEIEYIELDNSYDEEEDEMDFDRFLIKREIFYNLKDVNQLEDKLKRWINDFSIVEPILNVSHPES